MYGEKWSVHTLLAADMDDMDEADDGWVWVFAMPMRRRVDRVAFGKEKIDDSDWVLGVIWSSSSKSTTLLWMLVVFIRNKRKRTILFEYSRAAIPLHFCL